MTLNIRRGKESKINTLYQSKNFVPTSHEKLDHGNSLHNQTNKVITNTYIKTQIKRKLIRVTKTMSKQIENRQKEKRFETLHHPKLKRGPRLIDPWPSQDP